MRIIYPDNIYSYIPQNDQEAQDKKIITDCLRLFPHNILSRDNELAHITSSGFIINHSADKVLMIHHNVRNTWAWTGGHADGGADLPGVAVKEAFEETGVSAEPLTENIASIDVLTVSGHIRKGKYVSSHLHLSVAYILKADEYEPLAVKPDENSAVAWFPVEKINEDLFTDRDVYLYAKLLRRARNWLHTGAFMGLVKPDNLSITAEGYHGKE